MNKAQTDQIAACINNATNKDGTVDKKKLVYLLAAYFKLEDERFRSLEFHELCNI